MRRQSQRQSLWSMVNFKANMQFEFKHSKYSQRYNNAIVDERQHEWHRDIIATIVYQLASDLINKLVRKKNVKTYPFILRCFRLANATSSDDNAQTTTITMPVVAAGGIEGRSICISNVADNVLKVWFVLTGWMLGVAIGGWKILIFLFFQNQQMSFFYFSKLRIDTHYCVCVGLVSSWSKVRDTLFFF